MLICMSDTNIDVKVRLKNRLNVTRLSSAGVLVQLETQSLEFRDKEVVIDKIMISQLSKYTTGRTERAVTTFCNESRNQGLKVK